MSVSTQSTNKSFFIKNSLNAQAKMYIRKVPGIFIGNLTLRLEFEFPIATKDEILLAYLELMKEGFFFNECDSSVYPPEMVNEREKELIQFVHRFGLEDIDLDIILALEDLGKTANIRNTARKVISTNSTYDEDYVKIRIMKLFMKKFIIAFPVYQGSFYLVVNMDLLDGVVE